VITTYRPDDVIDAGKDDFAGNVERFGATIATVEPWSRHPDLIESPIPDEISNQEAYEREVVHRWAHSMQVQESGSIRRYYVSTHRTWTPRIPRFG